MSTTTTTTTVKPVRPEYPVPEVRSLDDFYPSNIAAAVSWHLRHGTVNWPMATYITVTHVFAVLGLFKVSSAQPVTLVFAFLLWPFSGLGITAGVHRLWSHRSYKAGKIARCLMMIMNSTANQGSIMHWARDHRVHHKHSETDADPHNATRGFFFAHMGWLYVKKHPDIVTEGKKLDMSDLEQDGFVMFQKALDPWFAFACCFVLPALVANRAWGEPAWTAFLIAGMLRYVVVLHFTWLVNSAAHFFGDHPYDEASWPSENPFVSFASVGEGWHNWHHKYPYDYAASEFGVTSQFNPTKLFIDTLCLLGLASDRKRATSAWERTKLRRDGPGAASKSAGLAAAAPSKDD